MRVLMRGGKGEELARIAAALRADGMQLAEPGAPYDLMVTLGPVTPVRLARGGLAIDLARGRAYLAGVPLQLTPIEFALLGYLAHADRLVSRGELLRELWGYRFDPGTNSVAVHISRLRAKIGREAIATEGDGYRLDLPGDPPSGKAVPDLRGAENAPLR